MAGLGLTQAVQAYQQGTEWRQRQDALQKQQQREAIIEQANQAAAAVIDASKAEWALNGAQGQYTPNDTTMFKAAEARGQALAKGGDWDGFIKNEATVQQQRIRVRANALQRYEQDGDFEALARTAYPTVFDGKEIVASERLGGMPALDSINRPATPTKFKFKLSDGSTQEVEPEQIIKKLKMSLIDPVKAAEQEVELNFKRTAAEIEAAKQKEIEAEKGRQARLTDGVRTTNDIRVEGVRGEQARQTEGLKATNAMSLADVNNKADQKRTETSAGATVRAAELGKEGRVEAAGIGAGKTPKPGDEVRDAENLLDTLAKAGIGGTKDIMTGVIKPDALTQKAAQRVNQYRKTGGLSFDDAVAKVREEMIKAGRLK